jgi:type II secretory pathway component GspD/PulD (secretin)
LGFSFLGIDTKPGQISGSIRVLLDEGKAQLRTHPIVVALNKTPAIIETVEEIPFQDVSFTNKGDPFLDVKYEKVGVKLEVTPTIRDLKRRIIELDIRKITVSSVTTYTTIHEVNRPVFAESTTNTCVEMKDAETIIIGGLKTRREVMREDRVPILGDIPILGWLFKSHTKYTEMKDTLFFITPHLLDPDSSPILPFDFVNGTLLLEQTR